MKRAVVGFAATAAGIIVAGGAAPQMAHASDTTCTLPQNLGPKGATGQPGPLGATGDALRLDDVKEQAQVGQIEAH